MDKIELKKRYTENKKNYTRLKDNLEDALRFFLDEQSIPYLGVYGRVKTFDSFYEKIKTKNYEYPFIQTEDFVGLRVILYFPSDINKVCDLISKKFEVVESEDKSVNLDVNEFGYRSYHNIIKIDKTWCKTPNYNGLDEIKSEVQVRTVLMHSWAEIEHKLQYKNKEQVPRGLQRKLFLLSAKLEEADAQFESIRDEANEYQKAIKLELSQKGDFDTSLEMNLETYKEFLEFFYPQNSYHESMTKDSFDLVVEHGLTYSDLKDIALKFKPLENSLHTKVSNLTRAATFSYALNIVAPHVTDDIRYSDSRIELTEELRHQYADV